MALLVLSTGALMIIVDETIVNVALPSVQRDLGFSPAGLSWVIDAYLIAFGGLLLLAGRLGDLVGRARIFRAGLALFTAASLACAVAPNPAVLVTGRFAQGAGGALLSAAALGLVVQLFPDPAGRARAFGVYGFVTAGGAALGLLLGGVLTAVLSWHWVFGVNVPIGLAVAVAARRSLPSDRRAVERSRPDVPGAVLVTAGLMLLVAAIVGGPEAGWSSPRTLVPALGGALLLVAFTVRQRSTTDPLLPPAVLRSRTLVGTSVALSLLVAGYFTQFFLGALYLQRVLGFGPLEVGLGFLPVAVLIGGISLGVTPRLVARAGERVVLVPAVLLAVLGLALLARVPAAGSYGADVLPALLLLGTSGGLALPAIMGLATSETAPEVAGLASGVVTTAQQAGGALGLAVTSSVAAAVTSASSLNGTAALAAGYRAAFAVAAGSAFAALLVVALGPRHAAHALSPRRPARARRRPRPGPARR